MTTLVTNMSPETVNVKTVEPNRFSKTSITIRSFFYFGYIIKILLHSVISGYTFFTLYDGFFP